MNFLFLILILWAAPVWGQVAVSISSSTNQLADELGALKASADRILVVNADLADRDRDLKDRQVPLQAQLQKAAQENNALTREALKLQDKNPSRARAIARLEQESFEVGSQLDRLSEEIKASQAALDSASKEDTRLTQRLKELGVRAAPAPEAPAAPVAARSGWEKEKLQLLKTIAESKRRQADLYSKIADVQNKRPVTVVTVQTSSQKQALANQVTVLQEQVDQLKNTTVPPVAALPITADQLQQLQAQVKALQQNHDELQGLANRMKQKAKKVPLTADQRNEENRLRASLADLNKEARRMKAQLNDLRRQMVALDKRKTSLGPSK